MPALKNPIVMIPARMASTRLPNKPLADIHGLPMIVHVLRRAEEAKLGRVVIACAEQEIKQAVEKAGGEAVLTDPNLPSGSDRILAALKTVDTRGEHEAVINVQDAILCWIEAAEDLGRPVPEPSRKVA